MTVPPSQPPRPSDETPNSNESPPNTPPTTTDSPPAPAPTPASSPAGAETPTTPPATTYLSGIVTAGLAAVCGAFFTSWAGVQGTLVGAMIGATIGSTVSEVVRTPLDALERRIVAAGVSARRLRSDGLVKTVVTSPTAAQQAFGMISRGAVVTVGATAILGFLLAVGGVTAVEVAAGEPLAAIVSDTPASGTTVGSVMQDAPEALAPGPAAGGPTLPSATTSGRSGSGVTSGRPADPVLGSEDPSIGASPSTTAAGTAPNEAEHANGADSPPPRPVPTLPSLPKPALTEEGSGQAGQATEGSAQAAIASPDAIPQPTPSATPATAATVPTTPTTGTSTSARGVEVVTVVVTATSTTVPTATATPTPSRTSTPTATSTATSALSAPATSPPAPASTPQT